MSNVEKALKDLEIIREAMLDYRNKVEEVKVKCIISPQFASIRDALTELQDIKEAKPSELLEKFGEMISCLRSDFFSTRRYWELKLKQALLKAQENEVDIIHYKGTIDNLKRDNAELKEILKIIKETNVDIEILKYRLRVKDDDVYLHYKYDLLMSREKFELLKRWVEND